MSFSLKGFCSLFCKALPRSYPLCRDIHLPERCLCPSKSQLGEMVLFAHECEADFIWDQWDILSNALSDFDRFDDGVSFTVSDGCEIANVFSCTGQNPIWAWHYLWAAISIRQVNTQSAQEEIRISLRRVWLVVYLSCFSLEYGMRRLHWSFCGLKQACDGQTGLLSSDRHVADEFEPTELLFYFLLGKRKEDSADREYCDSRERAVLLREIAAIERLLKEEGVIQEDGLASRMKHECEAKRRKVMSFTEGTVSRFKKLAEKVCPSFDLIVSRGLIFEELLEEIDQAFIDFFDDN